MTEQKSELLEYEVLQGRLLAETAAMAELDSLHQRGLITDRVCDDLKAKLPATQQALSEQLISLVGERFAAEQQQVERLRHHLINVKKAKLSELLQEGILSDESHKEAGKHLDQELIMPVQLSARQ